MLIILILVSFYNDIYIYIKSSHLVFFINLFIYFWLLWVFVAAQAFSSCGERGLLFVVVCGLLIAGASLVAEHGL